MKNLLKLMLLVCFSQQAFGQAGAKIYGGLTAAYNKDVVVAPEGTNQAGYIIGLDGRLNSDRMYFLLGAQYGAVELLSSKKHQFFSSDQMTFFRGRVGLGFDLIRLRHNLFITGKLLGSAQFVQAYDKSLLVIPEYNTLNDGIAGLVAGLGVRIGFINVDFEYEYGLFNLYKQKKETKVDYISLTAGVNF